MEVRKRKPGRNVQAAKEARSLNQKLSLELISSEIIKDMKIRKTISKSNLPKKMGGGLTEATKRLKAQGLKTGGRSIF